jgi:hypothetical protein
VLRVAALVLLLALPGCGDTTSIHPVPGWACYTLAVPPSPDDPDGGDECEFVITTSGPAQCEPSYGIPATQDGLCPLAGLVGCCEAEIGQEQALTGVCFYSQALASMAQASCTSPDYSWHTTAP